MSGAGSRPPSSSYRAPRAFSRARSCSRSTPAGRDSRSVRRRSQLLFETVNERTLRRQQLATCRIDVEPSGPIDLGKLLHSARARWPLDLERIARDSRDVEVAGQSPRVDDLAFSLPHLA